MLQVVAIREQFESYVEGLNKRGIQNASDILNELLKIDDQRKSTQQSLEEILSESNQSAKIIGQLLKEGKKEEAESAKAKTSELKQQSKALGESLSALEEELKSKLYNVPNIPHSSVPAGKNAEDNEVVKLEDSSIPQLNEGAKPHWDLIEEYDIIDFGLGNKITGAGFPVYKKEGARMVRAMINYFLDQALEAGYQEVQPPILINEDSGYGTGQLPDKEGQMYQAMDTNMYLIPTAEVPITNLYRDVIIEENQLPVKNVGYTPCFRREAGSWGSHVRGLNRLHQFDKVEIVQVTTPDKSYETLEQMVGHVEKLVASLGLPYRILRLCGGDMGFTSALTYDFEVYSAAQQKWLEVSSVSNFETYQANRLKLRIKDKNGKKVLAHTLNGSALAIPRILAAILENNQTESEIHIPQVLHRYTGFESIKK
ncbi:serine--tRNA ligase [Marinoscillum sp. MHG1-6]|uniref:serine--tRNA ligase n=1 Tax=Marinoscillum sp. MHG1-6 TaxID=2959627 RepID=UPI002156FD41|nr:serine--tRNA ligase [Marinoscillum sp. MHG1-6]